MKKAEKHAVELKKIRKQSESLLEEMKEIQWFLTCSLMTLIKINNRNERKVEEDTLREQTEAKEFLLAF